jgi:hypothetical protein
MGPELSAYSEGLDPKIVCFPAATRARVATRVIRGDVHAEVTALKAQPGADLLPTGGASIAAALTDLGLSPAPGWPPPL